VNSPALSAFAGLVFAAASLCVAQAQDLTPPVVAKPIADVTVAAGAAPTVINIRDTFGLEGVTNEVVRFTTTLGLIDVELYPKATPITVANFLSYVRRGAASAGGYNYSIIERSQPGYILQGGGYYVGGDGPLIIDPQAAIKSEAGPPNATGTIAMVLPDGQNSAQSAWFFNLADNAKLNQAKDGGPYTVFGRVIETGLETIHAITALQTYDLSTLGGAFSNVPLLDTYSVGVGATPADLVYTESIATIPLTPAAAGDASLLKVTVLNTNPNLVKATLSGRLLTLKYLHKQTGLARIALVARDAAKTKVKTSFLVTVQ
jgi:cyclophilin family peptidyl-prolyl cis-trans isomerase